MYNVTIYWDLLETTYGPLVCDPNHGDPDYVFVCSLALRVAPSVHILTGLWLFYTVYQYTKLLKLNKVNDPSVGRSASRNARTLVMGNESQAENSSRFVEIRFSRLRGAQQQLSQFGEHLTHGAQVYLVLGALSLSRSASLVLSGCGTSHPVDEFRGLLGDGFCKCTAKQTFFFCNRGYSTHTHNPTLGQLLNTTCCIYVYCLLSQSKSIYLCVHDRCAL
jgi:hypothetical protein